MLNRSVHEEEEEDNEGGWWWGGGVQHELAAPYSYASAECT